jgi:hypothetical protein
MQKMPQVERMNKSDAVIVFMGGCDDAAVLFFPSIGGSIHGKGDCVFIVRQKILSVILHIPLANCTTAFILVVEKGGRTGFDLWSETQTACRG